MEENKTNKKKKLTISLSSKRSGTIPTFTRGNKKSVIIEKKFSRRGSDRKFYGKDNNLNRQSKFSGKSKFSSADKLFSNKTPAVFPLVPL